MHVIQKVTFVSGSLLNLTEQQNDQNRGNRFLSGIVMVEQEAGLNLVGIQRFLKPMISSHQFTSLEY